MAFRGSWLVFMVFLFDFHMSFQMATKYIFTIYSSASSLFVVRTWVILSVPTTNTGLWLGSRKRFSQRQIAPPRTNIDKYENANFAHCVACSYISDTELLDILKLHWFAKIYGFTHVAIMFCISVKISLIVMAIYYILLYVQIVHIFNVSFLCGNIPTLNIDRGDLLNSKRGKIFL